MYIYDKNLSYENLIKRFLEDESKKLNQTKEDIGLSKLVFKRKKKEESGVTEFLYCELPGYDHKKDIIQVTQKSNILTVSVPKYSNFVLTRLTDPNTSSELCGKHERIMANINISRYNVTSVKLEYGMLIIFIKEIDDNEVKEFKIS